MIKLLFIIILLCSCSWTKAEITKETAWLVLHTVDYSQTRYAMDRPDEFKELNPLLGDHPSKGRLNTFALLGAILHPVGTHYLEEYRAVWQNITLGMKVVVIGNNFYVGAKIRF